MVNIHKASLVANGQQVTLTMPISKVDKEKRIVSGFATLDNVDRQGDRVTSEASRKAFENFRGNVRLMHQPIPAGKVVNFRTEPYFSTADNKQYNGVYVDAYISKGADNIWEMVLDGTLTGFSIGGNVKDSETVLDGESQKSVRIIKDYDLVELSLVDSPANQLANIFSIQKTEQGTAIADGIFNKSNIQNVFWCETDELAYVDQDESHCCANCGSDLVSIGWIDENTQEEVTKAVFAMIQKSQNTVTNEDTANKHPEQNREFSSDLTKVKTGDFVQWSSSGGTARGRVTRVVTNGKIKVPNSSFTITGTPDNPAVAIRVYVKDGNTWKPSGTTVGHRMNTLRTWTTKVVKFLGENTGLLQTEVVKKAIEIESVANQISKGGVEVAENTEETTEVVEEVLVDEVVEDVEETEVSEDAVEETAEETVEKSDEATDTETAEDAEAADEESADEEASTEDGEATDIEKALSEIKNFVTEALTGSVAKNTESISAVTNTVAEVTKALTEQIVSVQAGHDEINKALADITNAIASINGRMEAVEEDTAVKKSGELEVSPEKTTTMRKSTWGGRFLGSAEYLN